MTNIEKYNQAFVDVFDVPADQVESVSSESQVWDSVNQMRLVSEIESAFDIMFDTADLIDFDSYEKGKEILSKDYDVEF